MTTPQKPSAEIQERRRIYWKTNVRVILGCMTVWAVVSLGLGILFHGPLNNLSLGGYPFGFWVAQQGAIYTFLVLIFFYAWRMNKLDREFDVDEE